MNITFWLIVCVLIAVALLIIIPPLWRKTDIEDAGSDQRNINIAKERSKDLKRQLAAGALTQQQFDEHYDELQLTLGDDLDIEKSSQQPATQGRWVIAVICIVLPVFSVFTYYQLGEPDALIKAKIKPAQNAQVDVNAMVNQLAERLKQQPDNVKGWLMLGRSYKQLQRYQLAADAYAKAYALSSDEPEVMLHYADSLAMAKGGTLVGKPSELVFKALEKSPENVTALWLAGMAKAEQRQFADAMAHWRKLEKLLPAESDSYRELQGLIRSLEAQNTSLESVTASDSESVQKAAVVEVNVNARIADEIKAKVTGTDTVFIYAKALTGPPMPLAIVRKQVTDLPISVVLNDAMAMMPTMKLSKFNAVKVMARISKSGNAMQQKGDYIGSAEIKQLAGSMTVNIVINEIVK